MRFSKFKKYIRKWPFIYTGEVLINLENLETYHPENDKRVILVKDSRSYQKNGVWCIYPIAKDKHQVHIVCPYCGEIHSHGNNTGHYEGMRVPHCNRITIAERLKETPDYNIIRERE